MDEIAYHVDQRGAAKGMAFHLILAAVSLLFHFFASPLARDHPNLPSAWETIASCVGIAGYVLFAVLGLRFFRMMVSSEPYLVINAEGILDNASGMFSGAGWIPWGEIADIRLSKYHHLPCVELVPKDRERFQQRFGWAERINRSSRLGYSAVALRGPLLPVEPAVLAKQIQRTGSLRRTHNPWLHTNKTLCFLALYEHQRFLAPSKRFCRVSQG